MTEAPHADLPLGIAAGRPFALPLIVGGHGLIAGVTGAGKTTTARVLAGAYAAAGATVTIWDAKGDLARWAAERPGFDPVTADGPGSDPHRDLAGEGLAVLLDALDLDGPANALIRRVMAGWAKSGMALRGLSDLQQALDLMADHPGEPRRSLGQVRHALAALAAAPSAGVFDALTPHTAAVDSGRIEVRFIGTIATAPQLYAAMVAGGLRRSVADSEMPATQGRLLIVDEAQVLVRKGRSRSNAALHALLDTASAKGVGIVLLLHDPLELPAELAARLGFQIQHGLRPGPSIPAVAARLKGAEPAAIGEALVDLAIGEALISVRSPDDQWEIERVQIHGPIGPPGAARVEAFADQPSAVGVPRARDDRRRRAAARLRR